MLIKATICDHDHPERGLVTVPLPIPNEQYDQCVERVRALGIGDPLKKDCMVMELDSFFSVLKITEGRCVNLDELDYLAKRLDSFDDGEAAQFQAMASKLELFELKDLINLTFCCQQATVITGFSDLESVGRDHYMNTHAGCVLTEELEALDGRETALLLITDQEGTVTPYGVVYDNGMELEQSYDGTHFPAYLYAPEEYGKYMIQESGHFDYDPNLDEFYDYERYGQQHTAQQSGMFTSHGYISYHGTMSLEELMMEGPAERYLVEQGPQMGGMT